MKNLTFFGINGLNKIVIMKIFFNGGRWERSKLKRSANNFHHKLGLVLQIKCLDWKRIFIYLLYASLINRNDMEVQENLL